MLLWLLYTPSWGAQYDRIVDIFYYKISTQNYLKTASFHFDDHNRCYNDDLIMRNISTHEFLEHTGFWNITAIPNQFVEDSISANLTTQLLIEEFCHVGSAGEMFTSAAPQV